MLTNTLSFARCVKVGAAPPLRSESAHHGRVRRPGAALLELFARRGGLGRPAAQREPRDAPAAQGAHSAGDGPELCLANPGGPCAASSKTVGGGAGVLAILCRERAKHNQEDGEGTALGRYKLAPSLAESGGHEARGTRFIGNAGSLDDRCVK